MKSSSNVGTAIYNFEASTILVSTDTCITLHFHIIKMQNGSVQDVLSSTRYTSHCLIPETASITTSGVRFSWVSCYIGKEQDTKRRKDTFIQMKFTMKTGKKYECVEKYPDFVGKCNVVYIR